MLEEHGDYFQEKIKHWLSGICELAQCKKNGDLHSLNMVVSSVPTIFLSLKQERGNLGELRC